MRKERETDTHRRKETEETEYSLQSIYKLPPGDRINTSPLANPTTSNDVDGQKANAVMVDFLGSGFGIKCTFTSCSRVNGQLDSTRP